MHRSVALDSLDSLDPLDAADSMRKFRLAPDAASPGAERIPVHPADANWVVLDQANRLQARCSLWWKSVPRHEDQRLGLIGHYAAAEPEAAAVLLRRACAELTKRGCTMAVGPMDGSTWGNYRLITERGPEPVFFLEPDNPSDWPAQFSATGFFSLARYYSCLIPDLSERNSQSRDSAGRLREMGVEIRPIRAGEFASELRKIYHVVSRSFRKSFLYTPISESDFMAQYRLLRSHVRPELVLLAEREGVLIGFVFGVPDFSQLARASVIDTVIVKTLSVLPECAGAGLGGLLVERVQLAARGLGYRRAIHALMHESNASRRISAATNARTIRRYTLFAKRLGK
jgi:L-amino acid N-acyltransferase YncA